MWPGNDVRTLYTHTSGGMEGIDPVSWWRYCRSWMAVVNEAEKDAGKLRRGRMREASWYKMRRRRCIAWGCIFSRHAQRMFRAWEFSADNICINVNTKGRHVSVAFMIQIFEIWKSLTNCYDHSSQAICNITFVYHSQAFLKQKIM